MAFRMIGTPSRMTIEPLADGSGSLVNFQNTKTRPAATGGRRGTRRPMAVFRRADGKWFCWDNGRRGSQLNKADSARLEVFFQTRSGQTDLDWIMADVRQRYGQ